MKHTGFTGDPTFHLTCQRAVRELNKEYDWVSPQEDDLVALVLNSIQAEHQSTNLEKTVYSVALYEACRQAENPARREQGYNELHRFLFRVAYNRRPELAEDATQRALVLLYEQMDRCRNPATFLAFALFKLRHAFQKEQPAGGQELSWSEIELDNLNPAPRKKEPQSQRGSLTGSGPEDNTQTDSLAPQSYLAQKERLETLLEAIKRLPDERQQQVILLKFFGGLSDEAIARRLQLTPVNVRVLRHRGLKQLRRDPHLQDYFQEIFNKQIRRKRDEQV
jgi:RNA polymerase sigma factor (sigma-70 family)